MRGFMRKSLVVAFVAMLLTACGGPMFFVPGGSLDGEVVKAPVADWSFVKDRFAELETRPSDPYSVVVEYIVKDGNLYIDPAEARRWYDHIQTDPLVKVRFDRKVYPLKAVLVGRPGELEGFAEDRFIFRLDPRDRAR